MHCVNCDRYGSIHRASRREARRSNFQSALEQSEQFLVAAASAGYATRPVQLFYALSQAGRAIVAASPRIGNQGWRVSWHGLNAITAGAKVSDVCVVSAKTGLFPLVASALGLESLPCDDSVTLEDVWPVLTETSTTPLSPNVLLPTLGFVHETYLGDSRFSSARLTGIPRQVLSICADSMKDARLHSAHYPALRECEPVLSGTFRDKPQWRRLQDGSLSIEVHWREGDAPLRFRRSVAAASLGVLTYRSGRGFMVTPAVGTMPVGLHPILALWAVLLALSSLARYEPPTWSKMIDVDSSAEASAVEHLLDRAVDAVPEAVLHQLSIIATERSQRR